MLFGLLIKDEITAYPQLLIDEIVNLWFLISECLN